MTDLNPEGLERAAEAVLADSNSLATSAARRFARAAVTAYLGHAEVTTVEELDALPEGTVIQDRRARVWEADNHALGTNDTDRWCPIGRWRPFDPDHLPATVLHMGEGTPAPSMGWEAP